MSRSQCGRLEDSIEVWPIFGHQCVNLSNELKTHSTYLSEPTFARLVKINWSWTFQGVSKLGGRLSGMASGVMSSIQVDIYNTILTQRSFTIGEQKLWNPKHISIQHVLPESETGQLVVRFRYLAECLLYSLEHPPTDLGFCAYSHLWTRGESWWGCINILSTYSVAGQIRILAADEIQNSSFPEYIIVASCVVLPNEYLDAQWWIL